MKSKLFGIIAILSLLAGCANLPSSQNAWNTLAGQDNRTWGYAQIQAAGQAKAIFSQPFHRKGRGRTYSLHQIRFDQIVLPPNSLNTLKLRTYCMDKSDPAPKRNEKLYLVPVGKLIDRQIHPIYSSLMKYSHSHPEKYTQIQRIVWNLRSTKDPSEMRNEDYALLDTISPGASQVVRSYFNTKNLTGMATDFLSDKLGEVLNQQGLETNVLNQQGLMSTALHSISQSNSQVDSILRSLESMPVSGLIPNDNSDYSLLTNGVAVKATHRGGARNSELTIRNTTDHPVVFQPAQFALESKRETQRLGVGGVDGIKSEEEQQSGVGDLEVLDPLCETSTSCDGTYLDDQGLLKKESLLAVNVPRNGVVTDGVTKLLIRMRSEEAVTLNIVPSSGVSEATECKWGTLGAYNETISGKCSTLKVQPDKETGYVFALYTPPSSFPLSVASRLSTFGPDLSEIKYLTIKASNASGEILTESSPIKLYQPPVILIHGLWSDPCKWKKFVLGLQAKRFDAKAVDYEQSSAATFDPARHSIPVEKLIETTSGKLFEYRNQGRAITQVDIVGHSMGGLIARSRVAYISNVYKRKNNFYKGDYRKIITIGTPHKGSPFADALVDNKCNATRVCKCVFAYNSQLHGTTTSSIEYQFNSCPEDAKSSQCDPIISLEKLSRHIDQPACNKRNRNLAGLAEKGIRAALGDAQAIFTLLLDQPLGPGVYDLQTGSSAIKNIGKTEVPSHAIVGILEPVSILNKTGKSALDNGLNAFSLGTISGLLGPDNTHDMIVPVSSQKGGLLAGQYTEFGGVNHSDEIDSTKLIDLAVNRRAETTSIFYEVCSLLLADPRDPTSFGFFSAHRGTHNRSYERDKNRCH